LDEEDDVHQTINNLEHLFFLREASTGYDLENFDNVLALCSNKALVNEPVNCQLSYQKESYSLSLRSFSLEKDRHSISSLVLHRIQSGEKSYVYKVNDNEFYSLDTFPESVIEFVPFVPFGTGYESDLIDFFADEIDVNEAIREEFIERLRLFSPAIKDVRLGKNAINIYEYEVPMPMPLFTYGEGLVKFFRILCELAKAEGKRLMIDEIDTGIHHTKFVQFWKILIQAAKAYDVQLFATTHNEECLKYFQLALESEELEEERALARVVSFKLRKEDKIRAKVYDFEGLQLANRLEHEIRGGGL
jgi:hypothetical protein